MQRGGCVYILTNAHKTVLYTGVTSDLRSRVYQHKHHLYKNSFTDRYNVEYLMYYEGFDRIEEAIAKEKEIKKWNRQKKIDLITSFNPEWRDMWDEVSKW